MLIFNFNLNSCQFVPKVFEYEHQIKLRVRLVRELGGERRDFNGGEGRRDILIKNVFGSQGEGRGRDFKIILPLNLIK